MWFYCKFPKYSDTPKICCNHSKIWTIWLYHRVMVPNDADGMANSVDPDQIAPLEAVWSGSALFAQACLSENLGSLRYFTYGNLHVKELLQLNCTAHGWPYKTWPSLQDLGISNGAMSSENLFIPYAKNKDADQPAHQHSLISTFIVHCLDRIIPILVVSKISRI